MARGHEIQKLSHFWPISTQLYVQSVSAKNEISDIIANVLSQHLYMYLYFGDEWIHNQNQMSVIIMHW